MSRVRRVVATSVLAALALVSSAPLWAPAPAEAMGRKPKRMRPDTTATVVFDSTRHAIAPATAYDTLRVDRAEESAAEPESLSIAEQTRALADSLRPIPADSLRMMGLRTDSTVVITTRSAPTPRKSKAPPDPPYRIEADLESLDTGITYINAPTIGAEAHLPFGGVKQTGNGHREGGWGVYDFYSEVKVGYVDYSGTLQRAQIDNY